MDARELAMAMLDYEKAQRKADELRAQVEAAVLEIGETQQVGNVKATYRNGRKSYDYKAAVKDDPGDIVLEYTETKTRVDWRALVLDGLGINKDEIPFTQSDPSVSVKIVG